MKVFIILIALLNISAAHADKKIFFANIPSNATTYDAIDAVISAGLKKRWKAEELDNERVQLKLDHRGYKAELNFTFTDSQIFYVDSTMYLNDTFLDEDSNEEGVWEKDTAPRNWIKYLKNHVNSYFQLNVRSKPSQRRRQPVAEQPEDAETKLRKLKQLYDKDLITDEEYTLKKDMILSDF